MHQNNEDKVHLDSFKMTTDENWNWHDKIDI